MLKLPSGFKTYSIQAGVKYENRNDLGIIYSEVPANYSGVFTSNKVFAAPVKLCRERLNKKIQAVVVNSGNANACTGEKGYQDALSICKEAENLFQLSGSYALSLSTGVIGVPLPIERMLGAMKKINQADGSPDSFARTIMTTDTVPKAVSNTFTVKGKEITITGFAKGAGMIAPNMATMLGFVLTDALIEPKLLKKLLKENVDQTFNCITIDGDMSTNDSLILLANGKSGVEVKKKEDYEVFQKALFEVMETLSKMIVKDGEGATKLIEIVIENAKNEEDAKKAGVAIANSLLVKTAFFGNDPNWGRILCAAGYSGAFVQDEKAELFYLDRFIFSKGKPLSFDKAELSKKMKDSREITIRLNLNQGKASKRFFTCDLSYEYVKVNAEYTT